MEVGLQPRGKTPGPHPASLACASGSKRGSKSDPPPRPPPHPPPLRVGGARVARKRLSSRQRRALRLKGDSARKASWDRHLREAAYGPGAAIQIACLNAAGLLRGGLRVAHLLVKLVPESTVIVGCLETKLFEVDPSIGLDGWIWLAGFEFDPIFSKDICRRGQGILVRSSWAQAVSVLSKCPSHMWVRVRADGRLFAVCFIYLPPIGSAEIIGNEGADNVMSKQTARRLLREIFAEGRGHAERGLIPIYLGDFNAEIRPRPKGRPAHSGPGKELLEELRRARLCPAPRSGASGPTFFSHSGRGFSEIDHAFVPADAASRFSMSVSGRLHDFLGQAADHALITLSLPARARPPPPDPGDVNPAAQARIRWDTTGFNKAEWAAALKQTDLTPPPRSGVAAADVETHAVKVTAALSSVADTLLGRLDSRGQRGAKRGGKNYIRDKLEAQIHRAAVAAARLRASLLRRGKTPDPGVASELQRLLKHAEELRSEARRVAGRCKASRLRKHRDSLLNELDPRRFWTQEKRAQVVDKPPTKAEFTDPISGVVAGSATEVREGWRAYACRKGNASAAPPPEAMEERRLGRVGERRARLAYVPQCDLDALPTLAEVVSGLKHCRAAAGPGPDSLIPTFLKEGGEALAEALVALYSHILETGEWPDSWRVGSIKYILKSGPGRVSSNPDDSRPVTLLNIMAKVLEFILQSRLQDWIEERGSLADSQNGFRPKRSTEDNLLWIVEFLKERLARGLSCYLLFVDIKSACTTAHAGQYWPRRSRTRRSRRGGGFTASACRYL